MPEEENEFEYDKDYSELSPLPIDKRPIIFGTIFALVIILLFSGVGYWLFINPVATAVLRDIFIIFLGLGIFVVILLLIVLVVVVTYLVIKMNDLIQLLDREIRPLLHKTQSTVNAVKGTTTFLSGYAVKPVISTVSTVSAVRAAFRTLFKRK